MDSTPVLTRPEDVYSRCRVFSVAVGAVALGVSWDPETRVIFGQMLYHHGGCLCGRSWGRPSRSDHSEG